MDDFSRTRVAIDGVIQKGAAGALALISREQGEITGIAAGRAAPQRPLTQSTRMPWSCAGKPLLVVACLRLVAVGKFDLDVPIERWRPEFRLLHPTLTARHLLTHEAAVDEVGSPASASDRQLHEWAPMAGAKPGRDFIYSAWWNWSVLGLVLESVTGMSTESMIDHEVLRPAEMHDSAIMSPHSGILPNDIMEFTSVASRPAGWLPPGRLGLERRDPATRICGPLTDLVRFYRWLQSSLTSSGGPLPAPLAREMTDQNQSLGLVVGMKKVGMGKHCSPSSFGFGGALGGSNVVVGLVEPEHDFALAVVVNRIGRESAFGLKAIVTAMYEDVVGGPAALSRQAALASD
jgi:CubicO group peptidase (beta-lactamase class C family)